MTLTAAPGPAWSTLATTRGEGEFFYTQAWLDLIQSLYGYSVIPLTTTDQSGRLTGFLPVSLVGSPLTGRRLVSLPFSDYCPLLAADDDTATALVEQALQLAQTHHVRYLELRAGASPVLERRADLAESNLYVRWLVRLDAESSVLWTRLRKPVQRQVKKAQKLGVSIRLADRRDDMAQYHRLHLLTRTRKHGMPAQSQRFFLGLWDAFAADRTLQVLLAEYEGRVIAGIVLLASGNTLRYAYGASDERYLQLGPNNLLMWDAITRAHDAGYRTLDLGRTARDNTGLMEFKRGWGAVEEALPYYYYPQVKGLAATSERSWKYHLATSVWKRLPLPVAGALGAALYKHLG
jgi:FemAB-related protein (PEP-CTERM system-associated)